MNFWKRIASVILSAALVFSFAIPVSHAQAEELPIYKAVDIRAGMEAAGITTPPTWGAPKQFTQAGPWFVQQFDSDNDQFVNMQYGLKENDSAYYLYPTSSGGGSYVSFGWLGHGGNYSLMMAPDTGDRYALTFVAPQKGKYQLAHDTITQWSNPEMCLYYKDSEAYIAVNDAIVWPEDGNPYIAEQDKDIISIPNNLVYNLEQGDTIAIVSDSKFTVLPIVKEMPNENVAPVYNDATFTTKTAKPVEDSFAATDANNDVLTYTVKTEPANGTLVFEEDASFTYTANEDFVGTDSFVVTVSDGYTEVDGTATIEVEQNTAPVIENQAYSTGVGKEMIAYLFAEDRHDDPIRFEVVTNGENGTLKIDDKGKVTYTSSTVGKDTITYRALDDEDLASETKTITIHTYAKYYDATEGYSAAVMEADVRSDWLYEPFDSSSFAWQMHFRYNHMDMDGYRQYGRYAVSTGASYMLFTTGVSGYWVGGPNEPYMSIENNGLDDREVMFLNAGDIPANAQPIGALAFIAPNSGTYHFTASNINREFKLSEGTAASLKKPIKFWIEKNGNKVWPENNEYFEFTKEVTEAEFPEITTAMKKGDTVRFCLQGDMENGYENYLMFNPVAMQIGDYDGSKDLNAIPEEGVVYESDEPEPEDKDENNGDEESPGTGEDVGVAFPVAGAAVLAILLTFYNRKRKAASYR